MQNVGKAVDEVRRREHQSLCRKGDKSLNIYFKGTGKKY